MVAVFIVVLGVALVLQVLFSFLYWRWFPTWTSHPYGRLAQLGSFSHTILLLIYIFFILFGKLLSQRVAEVVFLSGFIPLIVFGVLQLILLQRAFDLAKSEDKNKEEGSNDS